VGAAPQFIPTVLWNRRILGSLEDAVELAWGALRGEEVEEVIDKGGAN
jgi:hypothetical protein